MARACSETCYNCLHLLYYDDYLSPHLTGGADEGELATLVPQASQRFPQAPPAVGPRNVLVERDHSLLWLGLGMGNIRARAEARVRDHSLLGEAAQQLRRQERGTCPRRG